MTKFKDTDRNNEESDIEAQTIANMTSRNSKNDVHVSSNINYVFPNASRANILKQSNVMRGSSNIPVYILPQLASPVVKLVNQISTWLKVAAHFWKLLKHCVEVRVPAVTL